MRSDSPTLQAPKRIEVFGFDVAEISQIRRIRALAALGHQVHSFTMRRENMNKAFEPDWPNTHLFMTENENLQKRVAVVAKSIWKMRRYRKSLATADMIIARNLDMLAIACAARVIAGAPRT
ncbi:MAG: glycosyl transferase, partial [Donghicola eburneus]|nr:glycosyl transferase [Donghicola eburneus]